MATPTGLSRRQGSTRILNQASVGNFAAVRMTDDEIDAVISNFAKEDELASKTWTRVVVEKFLSNFSWYFPRKGFKNAPSLSKAYAYYEHITLPRHFVGEQEADHVMRRAEPGESEKTELYNPFTLPRSALIEWGIGIDLYFSSLRIIAVTLLIAGLIHLPNAFFYAGGDYSPEGKGDLSASLRGSAICTTTEWVACVDCVSNRFDANKIVFADGRTLVRRNVCDGGQLTQGLVNYFTLFLLMGMIAFAAYYLRAREVRFDEDKVSASDYTIEVKNPPKDAVYPDEWRDFFTQFTDKQVTAITIALNNEKLLRKLIVRRVHRNNLRMKLPKGIDLDDEDVVRSAVALFVQERDMEPKGCLHKVFDCTVLPILRLFGMFLSAETLVDRVFQLTEQIKELQKEKYDAVKVFVTFETEEGQRAALSALTVSKLDAAFNRSSSLAPSAIFKDTVLRVGEPSEPSAIRWLDLSTSKTVRIAWRILNFFLTIGIVAGCGKAVRSVRFSAWEGFAGPLVSIFNSSIPQIVKILMIFEPHHTEGSYQTSLYLKITLFRWVNTALLTKFLTPFTSTLDSGNTDVLKQINNILWSELWLVPALRLLDINGNLKKHILGPRARTQEEMNSSFQGTKYNLGERYTDLTKVLFVCFFYSALYPTTFFFGFGILVVQYYTDKFCLTRIWSWSPFIGNELAKFSRRYFFSGALLAYALISSYAWAQFPYDNVCDDASDSPQTGAAGEYLNPVDKYGMPLEPITVVQDKFVRYCSQSWRDFDGFVFPPTERVQREGLEWMRDSQTTLSNLYGTTSLILSIIFFLVFFGGHLLEYLLSWFQGNYKPKGQDQHIDFSSNKEIFAYVPQIRWGGYPFPFLACDVDRLDQSLIGWNDPAHSYDYHNVIFDIPWEGMTRKKVILENTRNTTKIAAQDEYQINSDRLQDFSEGGTPVEEVTLRHPIFSVIKHYPPEWAKVLEDRLDSPKDTRA